MKLVINSLEVHKIAARDKIELALNSEVELTTHRDLARFMKRIRAEQLLVGWKHDFLNHEADLRGIDPLHLAQMIVAQPCEIHEREKRRQAAFAAVDAATSVAELDAILSNL